MYSLREAAEAIGLSKTAVLKAIKRGRISAAKDEGGEWRIDPAELYRVYPVRSATPVTTTVTGNQGDEVSAGLHREISLLRERVADLVEERDHWREATQQALRLLTGGDDRRPRPWWRRWRWH